MIRRTWLFTAVAAVAALSIFAMPHRTQAETPEGWKAFKGAFFEVGVPPGFIAKPVTSNGQVNTVHLVNKALSAEFMVFSPQWNGEAPFKKAADNEKLVSREVTKEAKTSTEDITIEAKDGSYTRFVVSQTFGDDANGSHTNKTFGIKVANMESYRKIKTLYLQWKKTLVQFAD